MREASFFPDMRNPGSHHMPDHLSAVLQHHNQAANFQPIALRARSHLSRSGGRHVESVLVDVDILNKPRPPSFRCLTNVHFVLKCSRRSMIGSAMRSRYICRSKNGFAPLMAREQQRKKPRRCAVCSVGRSQPTMRILKSITTQPVKSEVSKNGLFTEKITLCSIFDWCTASSSHNGQWHTGCSRCLIFNPGVGFVQLQ